MQGLSRLFANKKTMMVGLLGSVLLLFYDASFITMLVDVGVPVAVTGKLVTVSKLAMYVLTALGFSPLPKPEPKTEDDL